MAPYQETTVSVKNDKPTSSKFGAGKREDKVDILPDQASVFLWVQLNNNWPIHFCLLGSAVEHDVAFAASGVAEGRRRC